jgi:hypothetical protein
LLGGDLDTKFFQYIANQRKRKNNIPSLNINNEEVYDQTIIKLYILGYYKNLLGTINERLFTLDTQLWNDSERLSIKLKYQLEGPILLEEIKKVIFDSNESKSSGPNGLFHFIRNIGISCKMTLIF